LQHNPGCGRNWFARLLVGERNLDFASMALIEGESVSDLLGRQVILRRDLRRDHTPGLVGYDDRLDADSGAAEDRLKLTRCASPEDDVV
jgi:hypothetical protein